MSVKEFSQKEGYITVRDGAKIFYREQGQGRPLILVHGWSCSSKFWQKNVSELSRSFRVITPDLRGHGNSSKILSGHTIVEYAKDIRDLIKQLDLNDSVLAGWSLAGPVALTYYELFKEDSRLSSIALIDSAPAPFGSYPWNSHKLRNMDTEGMNDMFTSYISDPMTFVQSFAKRLFFNSSLSETELSWVVPEVLKTPQWISIAIYSDFLITDCVGILPTITIPAAVFASDNDTFKNGITMGQNIASLIPQSNFYPVENAGHTLFYDQPEVFNKYITEFINELSY